MSAEGDAEEQAQISYYQRDEANCLKRIGELWPIRNEDSDRDKKLKLLNRRALRQLVRNARIARFKLDQLRWRDGDTS
jgi:hypothetical protein